MGSSREDNAVLDVISLTTRALTEQRRSALSTMLESFSRIFGCSGCLVWELITKPGSGPETGQLFVLAHWMRSGQGFAVHDLPCSDSVTGIAVLNGHAVNIDDAMRDPRVHRGAAFDFLKRHNIKTLCSIPIVLSGKFKGALNLYRDQPLPFLPAEIERATHFASLIAGLYDSVWDKVSFNLITSVRDFIQKVEKAPTPKPPHVVMDELCRVISSAFDSLETSIFLEHRLENPGLFELAGTTCPEYLHKRAYRKSDAGLTGWVLDHALPVRILDLKHFKRDIEWIHGAYENIAWEDRAKVASITPHLVDLKPGKELPPISFMAAPIVVGDAVLGALRCCTARTASYYYADRDVALLTLVASQIGHFWNAHLASCEMEDENKSWSGLVGSLTKLNNFAQTELNKSRPDERRIFAEGLHVATNVITGADILDVRLYDDESKELYFAETAGQAWDQCADGGAECRNKRYTVAGAEPQSAGAWVFRNDTIRVMDDVSIDRFYDETFPGVRRMIIAPISLKGQKYGVLDIRSGGDRGFPRNAQSVAALLAQQMALYRYLAATIGRLWEAEAEQTRVYQDLEHQLKSPVIQVQLRTDAILSGSLSPEKVEYNLMAIRGLAAKAKQVVRSIGTFADLAQNKKLRLRRAAIHRDFLLKVLLEVCADSKLLNGPHRGITFSVDKSSFEVLTGLSVSADVDLLWQSLSNIIENAFKYSFDFTTVRIAGGVTKSGCFFIKVGNKGLSFTEADTQRSIKRGWRGSEAAWVTGSGSGIGLWLVDNVMEAHGGRLKITPTTPERWTEVSLEFPASGARRG